MKKDQKRPKISYEEHSQVFDYILKKDAVNAAAMMSKHLEIGQQMLII